jgi:hypothetical protein
MSNEMPRQRVIGLRWQVLTLDMTTLKSTVRIPKDVMFHDVSGEAVILDTATGKYYGLDEVGTRMWALLAEHGCLEPAYRALLDEYDVDEQRLRADLLQLVDTLAAKGLVKVDEA